MAGLCAVAERDAAVCTSVVGVALLFVHRRRRRRRYRQCTLKSLKFPPNDKIQLLGIGGHRCRRRYDNNGDCGTARFEQNDAN